MDKQQKEQKEPRIRCLNKKINDILNGELAEIFRELFEEVYEGQCDAEYTAILSALVLIEQQELPVAEMKFKGIGLDASSENRRK
jgi:hypothetical protein